MHLVININNYYLQTYIGFSKQRYTDTQRTNERANQFKLYFAFAFTLLRLCRRQNDKQNERIQKPSRAVAHYNNNNVINVIVIIII